LGLKKRLRRLQVSQRNTESNLSNRKATFLHGLHKWRIRKRRKKKRRKQAKWSMGEM